MYQQLNKFSAHCSISLYLRRYSTLIQITGPKVRRATRPEGPRKGDQAFDSQVDPYKKKIVYAA